MWWCGACVCIYIYTYTRIYLCIYVCIYIYMCAIMNVCIYTYICITILTTYHPLWRHVTNYNKSWRLIYIYTSIYIYDLIPLRLWRRQPRAATPPNAILTPGRAPTPAAAARRSLGAETCCQPPGPHRVRTLLC